MSELVGGTENGRGDAWFNRWQELDESWPAVEPTDDEVAAARLQLLQEVTFADEAEAANCDDLAILSAETLERPEAFAAYVQATARHARITSVLVAEGLMPPAPEE